ncbi:hypothetical protein LL946_18265 [Knoellia locipacati]|uniref:hypothetical protein n=1 Tax=Knoellia locipacati TaxID=882824 RepID=UPI00384ADDF0
MDADARLDAAVGSVAEEATRLLEALGRGPQPRPDEGPTAQEDLDDPDQQEGEHVHVAMGDAESCTWCPVCRSVTALRGVSPETLSRLADLATTAATVLADLASRHTESAGANATERHSTSERTPRTEPITVVDEEDAP